MTRPWRYLLVFFLAIAELATLAAIVLVLRTSVGTPVWSWNWNGGWSAGGAQQASEERVVPLTNVTGALMVHNDMGRIHITSGSTYAVRAVVYGFGHTIEDAQDSLKLVSVTSSSTGNGTKVVVKGPQGWVGRRPYANLEVVVPANAVVEADADMGEVVVRDVTGSVKVDAGMGRVQMDRVKGNVDVDANMGSIDLREMTITNTLEAEANMGSVSFMGMLGKENSFEADMGSITVDLAQGQPALKLDAEWNMGKLHNNLPLNGEIREHKATGLLGRGTGNGELKIKSGMGSITLR